MGWHCYYMSCMQWQEDVSNLEKNGWRKPIHEELINHQGTKCWKCHTEDDIWKASYPQR